MINKAISVLLVIVGFINFFPLIGIVSPEMLVGLYGIESPSGDLLILLRHRALLFGMLGTLIIVSAFNKALRPLAIAAAFVAMAGFIALAMVNGDPGEKIQSVANIDVVAVLLLVIVVILKTRLKTENQSEKS